MSLWLCTPGAAEGAESHSVDTVRGFLGNFSDIVSNRLTVGPRWLESGPLPLQSGLVWVGLTHLEAAVLPVLMSYLAWTMSIHLACSTMLLPSSLAQVTLLVIEAFTRSQRTDVSGDNY